MKRGRTLAAGALTAMLLVATAGAAAAEPIEHAMFEEPFSNEIDCGDGLNVLVEGQDSVHFLLLARGPGGMLYGQANIAGAVSFTNPANGNSVTSTYHHLDKDLKVTDNGDGTYTVVVLNAGSQSLFGPDGRQLLLDAGQLLIELVLDVNGEFISGEVLRQAGRWDTDGRDFCSDMHEFLG